MMVKQSSLTRSEKRLLLGITLFVAGMIAVLCWFQVTGATPQVTVPTPVMPAPNAFDVYLKACNSITPITLPVPANTSPGKGVSLSFGQIEMLMSDGKTPGHGPGMVKGTPPKPSFGEMQADIQAHGTTSLQQPEPSFAEMQALIQANAPAFNLLHQGFQYEYREPPVRSYNQLLPHFSRFREMARVLDVVGYVKRNTGDWNGATNAYLDSVQLGIETPHGGPMISMLVGVALQAIGRTDIWSTVDHLNATQARFDARRMETLLDHQMPFADTLQEEQWTGQASLLDVFRRAGWRKELLVNMSAQSGNANNATQVLITKMLLISKRQVMDNYTRYTNAQIANARLPYAAPKAAPPLPNDPFCCNLLPIFDKAWIKENTSRTQNALLTVTFALRAYYVEHGQYPASLKELTPTYLHAIPADPFALNGALRYKRTGTRYLLYSVGPDGKDDGGKASNDGQRAHQSPRYGNPTTAGSKGDIVSGVNEY